MLFHIYVCFYTIPQQCIEYQNRLGQLHAISRIQQSRQKEPSVKTLRSRFYTLPKLNRLLAFHTYFSCCSHTNMYWRQCSYRFSGLYFDYTLSFIPDGLGIYIHIRRSPILLSMKSISTHYLAFNLVLISHLFLVGL